MRMMNISLLCKWWWKFENNEGLWQDIVKIKYVKNTPISFIKCRQSDSPMGGGEIKVRHIYLQGREFKINSGRLVSFWLDPWMNGKPLCTTYHVLYDLCMNQRSSVREVMEMNESFNSKFLSLL
jgi:hypothetical protein